MNGLYRMAALRGFTSLSAPAVETRTSPCSALNARPLAAGAGENPHYRVNFYDSTATCGGSKAAPTAPPRGSGPHGQPKDGERG
jgi:hypothetical protein